MPRCKLLLGLLATQRSNCTNFIPSIDHCYLILFFYTLKKGLSKYHKRSWTKNKYIQFHIINSTETNDLGIFVYIHLIGWSGHHGL